MRAERGVYKNVDWMTIILYLALVFFGWLSIYAANYNPDAPNSIFDFSAFHGKQLLWITVAFLMIAIILLLDFKLIYHLAYPIYAVSILSLIGVLFFGVTINDSHSWYAIGGFRIQPAEFSKLATALAVAKYIDEKSPKYDFSKKTLILFVIAFLAPFIILLQNETGSALVFSCFIVVFFIDGLNVFIPFTGIVLVILFVLALIFEPIYIVIGLFLLMIGTIFLVKRTPMSVLRVVFFYFLSAGIVFGSHYFVYNVLQEHQQRRIETFLNPENDPQGAGYQVIKSKTAIGAGGLYGKGYLNGDLTQLEFVPEQHTDFIFCTIGEERGFLGTTFLVVLYITFLLRIGVVANRQKSKFASIYGFGVMSILFFHMVVNVGMTIGLFPIIGIPLPFISYGGSSLWAFTLLLSLLIKLDMHRTQILAR